MSGSTRITISQFPSFHSSHTVAIPFCTNLPFYPLLSFCSLQMAAQCFTQVNPSSYSAIPSFPPYSGPSRWLHTCARPSPQCSTPHCTQCSLLFFLLLLSDSCFSYFALPRWLHTRARPSHQTCGAAHHTAALRARHRRVGCEEDSAQRALHE